MSHTFKTDPYWVRVARDGYVEHDHARGECLPGADGPYYSRPGYHHTTHCPRISYIVGPCPGDTCYGAWKRHRAQEDLGLQVTSLDCGHEHTLRIVDDSKECAVCDIPSPTCTLTLPYGHPANFFTAPPAWYRKHTTHAPNRVEIRRVLGDARREYNAGVRIDDGDEIEDAWEPNVIRAQGYWW